LTRRYRFISEHCALYGVARLCRVLAVTRRQGYYEWRAGEPARQERDRADEALVAQIRAIHAEHHGRYGSPRVHHELRRRGQRINRKRVERLMRERGIVGRCRRRRRSLTKPDAAAVPAPDLVGRDFTAHAPGQRLVGDITYLPTAEGWLYLACGVSERRAMGAVSVLSNEYAGVLPSCDFGDQRSVRINPACRPANAVDPFVACIRGEFLPPEPSGELVTFTRRCALAAHRGGRTADHMKRVAR
jgi:hypothetical protein